MFRGNVDSLSTDAITAILFFKESNRVQMPWATVYEANKYYWEGLYQYITNVNFCSHSINGFLRSYNLL